MVVDHWRRIGDQHPAGIVVRYLKKVWKVECICYGKESTQAREARQELGDAILEDMGREI